MTCKLVNAVNDSLWFQEWNKNLGATQDPSNNAKRKSVIPVNERLSKSPCCFFILEIIFYFAIIYLVVEGFIPDWSK